MKNIRIIAGLAVIAVLIGFVQCQPRLQDESIQELFELRIYNLKDIAQEEQLDTYLEEALLPALKRNQVRDIGVFKYIPEIRDSLRQTFVLYPVKSAGLISELPMAVFKDSLYQKKGDHILNAPYDQPPYERMEVILLKPFEGMPFLRPSTLSGEKSERVYELRSYESPTEALFRNKVEMFNAGGEIELFEKLGFHAVFYGEVLAGPRMPNLMYMTTFDDMQTRDSIWQVFFDSPEWKALINDPYYDHNVNKADILLLTPTSYSDY
jgi:hypothetical protein